MAGKIHLPLAVACALAGSGNCFAEPADQRPAPVLHAALQTAPRSQIGGAAPRAPGQSPPEQATVPGARVDSTPSPGLRMARVLEPLPEAARPAPTPVRSAQLDSTPSPVLRMAGVLAPLPQKAGRTPREDGPLLLAQAELGQTRSDVSPAAAPRPGSGASALKADRPPAPGPVLLAQAEGALPGIRVAAAAAPQPGKEESALIPGSATPEVPRPKKNRASATANMGTQVAQGPNGKGKGDGEAKEAGGTGFSLWKIPPIRWGGDVSLNLSSTASQGSPRTTQVYESVGIRADSYVFQPWFARVSGALRVMQVNEGLTKRLATGDTGSTTYTGNGNLALFPVSRFPFNASYDVSDSRSSGELVPSGYTSRRLGLRQSYAPLTGNANYLLSFDRSVISSDAGGTDIAKSLVGTMNNNVGFHSYNLNASSYSNTHSNTGDKSQINRINANYDYRPGSTLSVANMVNLGTSDFRYSTNGAASDSRDRYLQMNSFATWRPGESSPLMVTGGARLYQSRSTTNGTETEASTIAGNAAATYTLNRNTVLTGSGTMTQASSAGRDTTLTNLSAGANYTGDAIRFGEYSYGWGGGANVSRQNISDQASTNTVGTRIGHSLNRGFRLAENSNLMLNASQSFSKNTGSLPYQTLVNSGGVSWNLRPSDATSTLLALNMTDTRSTGALSSQHFQMVNLQGNGNMQINRYSSGGVNMTIQGTRQTTNTYANLGTPAAPTSGFNWSTNGGVNYQHARAFGVPRLRYTAMLNMNQFQNRTRFDGDINAPIARINKSFEQRLDYNIGRTDMQLLMRFAEMEGRSNSTIFFRIIRPFGSY